MERQKFPYNAHTIDRGHKRVKQAGGSDELQQKIGKLAETDPEHSEDTPFSLGSRYISDSFVRQAEGLRRLREVNDPSEQSRQVVPQLLRRKEVLNSIQKSIKTEHFTSIEEDQLLWQYRIGIAFINQLSKTLRLFNAQYAITAGEGSKLSNLVTAEFQQQLVAFLIERPRRASDSPAGEHPVESGRYFEEVIFPMLHTMSVNALGLEEGERLFNIVENGVYATAAAYFMYSNASQNRFGKSFKVMLPSPYLDAFEQTDLLLVDEEGIDRQVWKQIQRAFDEMYSGKNNTSINDLTPEAKKHIYKVQVKNRAAGPTGLTSEEEQERDRFVSARCRTKGFDNWDYLVLTADQARTIVHNARKEVSDAP